MMLPLDSKNNYTAIIKKNGYLEKAAFDQWN